MGNARTSALHRDGPGIVAWRRRALEAGGFQRAQAQALASDPRSDVHSLLELVERGCPPHLAARILAPLEDLERRT